MKDDENRMLNRWSTTQLYPRCEELLIVLMRMLSLFRVGFTTIPLCRELQMNVWWSRGWGWSQHVGPTLVTAVTRNAENFAQNSSEDNLGNICAVYLQHSMIFKAGLVASIVSEQKFSFYWTSASQIFVTFGEKICGCRWPIFKQRRRNR